MWACEQKTRSSLPSSGVLQRSCRFVLLLPVQNDANPLSLLLQLRYDFRNFKISDIELAVPSNPCRTSEL